MFILVARGTVGSAASPKMRYSMPDSSTNQHSPLLKHSYDDVQSHRLPKHPKYAYCTKPKYTFDQAKFNAEIKIKI